MTTTNDYSSTPLERSSTVASRSEEMQHGEVAKHA